MTEMLFFEALELRAILFSIALALPNAALSQPTIELYVNYFKADEPCDAKPFSKQVFIVNVASGVVIKNDFNLDGSSFGTPTAMTNCKITDVQNWVCGGKMKKIADKIVISPEVSVFKGEFYIRPSQVITASKSLSIPNTNLCIYEKTLFGYKFIKRIP